MRQVEYRRLYDADRHPGELAMTHPKPDNASLACFICGKQKGQPPERCNGHYDNAPTPTGPVLSAELEIWLCSPHKDMDATGSLKPLDNCVACLRNERDELRALLAQRDKRAEHLLYALRTIRGYFADLENGILEDDPLKPIRMMAHAKFHRVIEAAMKEPA